MNLLEFTEKIKTELNSKGIFYLRIKIRPNSPKNALTEILELEEESTIKMNIKASPIKGLANKEIIKFLNKKFNCQTEIISGKIHSLKLIKLWR